MVIQLGCREQIMLELPEERRMVVISELSTNKPVEVEISLLEDILQDDPENLILNDIQLALLENGQIIDYLNYDAAPNQRQRSKYVSDVIPQEGLNYSLEGISRDYLNFNATTQIPIKGDFKDLHITETQQIESEGKKDFYEITMQATMKPFENDRIYFEMGVNRNTITWDETILDSIQSMEALDFDLININHTVLGKEANNNKLAFLDKEQNKTFIIKVRVGINPTIESKTPILLSLKTINQDYYNFHKDVIEQTNASNTHEGIFFNEPFFIHNNIEGGVGILSAYVEEIKSVDW